MRRQQGFTLTEWIVAILAIAGLVLLVWAILPRGRHFGGHGYRCASTIGKALSIYTSDPANEGIWPWVNGTNWESPTGTNRLKAPPGPTAAPDDRAITSLLFLLVRQNSASVRHFKCPSDQSVAVQSDYDVEKEYDFADARNVSYSYAAPIPAEGGRWQSGASVDARQAASVAVLSDRNPMHDGRPVGPWGDNLTDAQRRQRLSSNHHGEAINVIWLDFHVSTETRADIGVQNDNIYTAGGTDAKNWRTSVNTSLTDHNNAEDSFLIGPYGKKPPAVRR